MKINMSLNDYISMHGNVKKLDLKKVNYPFCTSSENIIHLDYLGYNTAGKIKFNIHYYNGTKISALANDIRVDVDVELKNTYKDDV